MTAAVAHIVEEEGDAVALCGAPAASGDADEWQLCQECLDLSLNLGDDE